MNQETNFLKIEYYILRDTNFNPTEKLIYAYLNSFIKSTGNAFPTVQTMADEIGVSKRTVQNALDKLETHGKVRRVQRFNKSSIYLVDDWRRGAEIAPQEDKESLGVQILHGVGAESAPLGVQELPPTISINISPTRSIKDNTDESGDEEEMKPFESKATHYVRDKLEKLSTVSIPSSDSVPSLNRGDLTATVFREAYEAYKHVVSMGSKVSEKDFNYIFGSTMKYEEPELGINIKRVYG